VNALLCGQDDLVQLFARKGDPYSNLASNIFGYPVDKKTNGGLPRFIGKGGELGLGFGCGDAKFYTMVIRQARGLFTKQQFDDLMKIWTPQLSKKAVDTYRTTHGAICTSWKVLDNILHTAWLGSGPPQRFGPCLIGYELVEGVPSAYVEGPSGLRMWYAKPRIDEEGNLRYDYGKRSFKMYGSKFLENIVQFLARIDTMHDACRIAARGYKFCLQSHDELCWIVPEDKAADCLAVALEEMRRPPSWAPNLPLDAEGNIGASYGDAK
jgi:DNA polymerase